MSEQEYGPVHDSSSTFGFKDVVGYAAIICGAAILVWVFINVYGLFTDPAKLTPFQNLVSASLESSLTSGEKQGLKLVVPAEVLSYFVPLVLLLIAAGIGRKLFAGGVQLLGSDVGRLSRKVTTMGDRLAIKMDRIEERMRKQR